MSARRAAVTRSRDQETYFARVMVGVLVVAAAYWLWIGISQRSIVGDDGISILAAQGILEHGIPRLPSGFIYHRAYLPTYLVAGSIGLFGANEFGIMLPSLLLSLGSLYLVYRLGAEVVRQPRAGLAAALLLLALQGQAFYATSPRMYMALQTCTLLAVYGAWRGFVHGERTFQWVALVAAAGAIFSHQQGGSILVAVPVTVALVRWMQGRARPLLNRRLAFGGLAGLWGVVYVAVVYRLPGRVTRIADQGGQDPHYVELNLNLGNWWRHARELEAAVPGGLLVAPIVVWLVVRAVRTRTGQAQQGIVFLATLCLLYALMLMSVIVPVHWRFWFLLLPLYALVLSLSVTRFVIWFRSSRADGAIGRVPRRTAAFLGLLGWSLAVFLASSLAYGPATYAGLGKRAYGPPCINRSCSKSLKAQYAALRPAVAAEDVIISSNPWVTNYYLGRVDGFLRERLEDDGRLVAYESPTDEYFGIALIDTPAELDALKASEARVWILTDLKAKTYSSQRTHDILDRSYTKYLEHKYLTVYTNRTD